MKKILSIFAALALTISASATPLALDVANVSNENLLTAQAVAKQTSITGKPSKYALAKQMTDWKANNAVRNIHTTGDTPTIADTIDITIGNLEVTDFTSFMQLFWLEGYTMDYEVSLTIMAKSVAAGTYTSSAVSATIVNTPLKDTVDVLSATVDVFVSEKNKVTASAKVVSKDNKLYRISMAYVIPDPIDTLAISFKQSATRYYMSNYNGYGFEAEDDKYIVAAYAKTSELNGTFEGDDFDIDNSGVGIINGKDTTIIHAMAGKVTFTPKNDTLNILAEIIGMDSILYQVSMFYAIPQPKDTMDLIIKDADMVNLTSMGIYQLQGYTEDYKMLYIAISSYTIEGDFTVDNFFAQGEYTIFQYMTDDNQVVSATFLAGNISVSLSDDNIVTMKGQLLASDTILYNVNMSGKFKKEGLSYDAENGPVNREYTNSEIEFDTKTKGRIYATLKATNGSDMALIGFNVEATDPDITIPAGVYTIDKSGDKGTVIACPGIQGGKVTASFYGKCNASGALQTPMYFMVAGTVTVENRDGNLFIEVDALNSFDIPIHVTYTVTETALENSTVESSSTRKVIENGQLLILRGNDRFNVLGTKIQ